MKTLLFTIMIGLTVYGSAQQADSLNIFNTQWNLDYEATFDSLLSSELSEFQSLSPEFQSRATSQMITYQLTFNEDGTFLFSHNGVLSEGTWTQVNEELVTNIDGLYQEYRLVRPSYSQLVLIRVPQESEAIFNKWYLNKN